VITLIGIGVVYVLALILVSELAASCSSRPFTAASVAWFLVTLVMVTLLEGWAVLTVLVALMIGGINLLLAVLMDIKQ